ncbi:uncharacterized protein B0I36DRAFT_352956 [Microdochium trichocladiopsis]|uniref:Uncharacterized protein n=1 Tax=Microdochium trichocladiopsis TaxID=1682393 RepID=A0A9P9BLC7_9PEZI|nr:uncharacterized protein B0I36DRAFT_352956 [Microdochium trichocladiopsis]KAH7024759.1 hypothetical protein B0I36DRAFT_352956 [Microdochium trichocladiopsis]
MHFSAAALSAALLAGITSANGGDTLQRDICKCDGAGQDNYNIAISYCNGRLQKCFNAHRRCQAPLSSPSLCSLDIFYYFETRICGEGESSRFCYEFVWPGPSRDKYFFDGKEATRPEKSQGHIDCNVICRSLWPGTSMNTVASKSDIYYGILPGL